ncbi:MAG: type II toxin-antitoxin system VapB family antitoxin [Gemmatimonadota bacterium]|nr:type II toxin-antitoxin system VapB family antitoxin [Gemmatimonadota bacterium]
MRTTLTIDDDVAIALERIRDRDSLSLKAAVNEALRRGIRSMDAETEGARNQPYRIRPWDSGGMRVSVDDVTAALGWAEGEAWR